VPLLVSDLVAGLPFEEDPPLPAAGVDVPPVGDDPLELVDGGVTDDLVSDAGVVAKAGVTDVGSAETEVVVAPLLCTAALSVKARAGAALTSATSTLTGGALFSVSGIAVPADAAGTLGDSPSARVTAGRSARPSAKQQANTAAPTSTDTSAIRR
jgi:hypothetical protein